MAPIPPERQVNGFLLNDEGELDFSDLEKEYEVSYEEGFDNVILVDNCPIVEDEGRKQKLITFLRRIFSASGTIRDDGIFMPVEKDPETGKITSKGYVFALGGDAECSYVFIEYDTPVQAAAAIKTKEGYALDKSHKLRVNRFTDVEKYTNMSDTYVEPEVEPYVKKEHLRSWLKDSQGRDQFFLYQDVDLSVCYNRKKEPPEVVKSRTVTPPHHFPATLVNPLELD
jgi:translation initiation factor 3 subunit B